MPTFGDTAWDLVWWGGCCAAWALAARAAWKARAGGRGAGPALAALALLGGFATGEWGARLAGVPRYRGLALLGVPLDARLGWCSDRLEGRGARRRALVLGDSFTAAAPIPPGQRYFAALEALGFETWVYAAPGWGTLQEVLAAEQAWPRAQPELVVLQVCSNDFINNDWELERQAFANNNLSRRPYFEDGRVVWREAATLGALRRWLSARSALASWLNRRWHLATLAAQRRWRLDGSERRIVVRGRAHAPFARSLRTTETLVARLVALARGRVLVALPADSFPPYADEWRALLARQGVPLLEAGLAEVERGRSAGRTLHSDATHWNAAGHALVGAALREWVARQESLCSAARPCGPPTAATAR